MKTTNLGEILKQEKQDLIDFHSQNSSGKTKDEKIEALKNMASRVYFKRSKSLARFRRKFNKSYQNMFTRDCFACGEKTNHRHHIIQLQHGGNNSKKNRIPLCRTCHVTIHPWMVG